jgi:Protein of unknown function (DUF3455)
MRTQFNQTLWLVASALLAVMLSGCERQSIPTPQVPDRLKVPAGEIVLLETLGKDVQIYACEARADDPGKFEWTFKAPEASLTDGKGASVAKHYAGPTWEAKDGSNVVGEVLQKLNAPEPGSVPWLLLRAKSNEGSGEFRNVTYVQRVNTRGGIAPAEGCDQAHAHSEVRVPHQANYYFYVSTR